MSVPATQKVTDPRAARTLRKRLYWLRPSYLSLCELERARCMDDMQGGKWRFASSSTMSAVISAPSSFEYLYSDVRPAIHAIDRWFSTGIKRSSSSRRGRALAVNSSARDRRAVNSAHTSESCRHCGTYA